MAIIQVKHAERAHSKFSASSSDRWLNCPGSIALSKNAPPEKPSFYAKEGTDAHECLEFIVKRFKNLKRAEKEALEKWPAEMVEYAVLSAGHVYALRPSPSAKLLTEQRVYLSSISKKLYGTLDYAWVEDWGELVIIDYKYGAGVTVMPCDEDGNENTQLLYYALGACEKFGFDFETVKLAVIQPRVWREDDNPTATHETTITKVKAFRERVKKGIEIASKPNAPLKAGEHCKWCPAKPLCPEISKNSMEKADILFDLDTGEIEAIPDVKLIPVEALPNVLDACNLLETWIKSLREFAYQQAESGNPIDGYKLVARRSTRSWTQGAQEAAEERFGNRAFLEERKFLSPAQLEKKIGKKEVKDFTDEFTSSISSGFNLVPESDKRPPVNNVLAFDIGE